jgi:hypothetical protein
MTLRHFVGPWQSFQFRNRYDSFDGGSARRKAATYRTQTQNKRTQTSTPRIGFEPTTPVLARAKTIHDLDRAATVIGGDNGEYQRIWKEEVVTPFMVLFRHISAEREPL